MAKTKSSYVYNISFLLCEEVTEENPPVKGDILIKVEGG